MSCCWMSRPCPLVTSPSPYMPSETTVNLQTLNCECSTQLELKDEEMLHCNGQQGAISLVSKPPITPRICDVSHHCSESSATLILSFMHLLW